jgi:hypothetical protein
LPFYLLLLVAPLASADELMVVDISRADAAQVERLKHGPADGWWLEMGLQLVVFGAAAMRVRAIGLPRMTSWRVSIARRSGQPDAARPRLHRALA